MNSSFIFLSIANFLTQLCKKEYKKALITALEKTERKKKKKVKTKPYAGVHATKTRVMTNTVTVFVTQMNLSLKCAITLLNFKI